MLLRRAIRDFTGQSPRGAFALGCSQLDFEALVLALRPGSAARDCLRRLNASAARLPSGVPANVPKLEELPLAPDLAIWGNSTLDLLRDVKEGREDAASLSFGILEGPPGTGKTLIASALARSAGWNIVSTSVSSWFVTSDGHLGGVSRACAAFFDAVLAQPNTIGFLDEIDALPDRASLNAKDRDWWTSVITLVLLQIDRVRQSGKPVLLLGATNFFERLDGALIRAQRLEQRIPVLPPHTEAEAEALLSYYLGEELDSEGLAKITRFAVGATPATVLGWARAARNLAHGAGRKLQIGDVLAIIGPPDQRSAEEIHAVAVHEAGHAVLAHHLGIPVNAVSIIPSGPSGGATTTGRASTYPNQAELENHVTMLLGGRAADLVVGTKGAHAGAAMDLSMATRLLQSGISEWGLYHTLSPAIFAHQGEEVSLRLEAALSRLLSRAVDIVIEYRHQVVAVARALVNLRLLTAAEFIGVLAEPDALMRPPKSFKPPQAPAPDHQRAKNRSRQSSASRKELRHD
jgi:ATP-dependent Zn protease